MTGLESHPVVSVILPVWNGERFLSPAIESIRAQTFEAFELLLIDDGSTDGSLAIAEKHAAADPRLRVIRREHCGLVHALNAGLEAARAPFVARMDSDDLAYPTRLAMQVTFLQQHPQCLVVGSNCYVIDEDGDPIGGLKFPRRHEAIRKSLLSGVTALAHPAVMMRKGPVIAAGGYRADSFPCEDIDLWVRLSEAGELANLCETLLRYRRHEGTICIRERYRQSIVGAAIVGEARQKRGLGPIKPRILSYSRNVTATYHLECARTALFGGRRRTAFKHAKEAIVSAPLWSKAYTTLVACALPSTVLRVVQKFYTRLRTTPF